MFPQWQNKLTEGWVQDYLVYRSDIPAPWDLYPRVQNGCGVSWWCWGSFGIPSWSAHLYFETACTICYTLKVAEHLKDDTTYLLRLSRHEGKAPKIKSSYPCYTWMMSNPGQLLQVLCRCAKHSLWGMRILCSPTWDGDLLTLLAVHKERVFVVSVSASKGAYHQQRWGRHPGQEPTYES